MSIIPTIILDGHLFLWLQIWQNNQQVGGLTKEVTLYFFKDARH